MNEADELKLVRQSRDEWLSIIDAITDFMFVIDDTCTILKVNRALASFFGSHPKDFIGKKCYQIFDFDKKCDDCIRDKAISKGLTLSHEKMIHNKTYRISVFPLYQQDKKPLTVHLMKDVTEIKNLRMQLYDSERLASVGRLTAGVAHEINNPLSGIIAYTDMLAKKNDDGRITKDIENIRSSAERCKNIIDILLKFSGQTVPSKSIELVHDVIDRVLELRAYWLRMHKIRIIREYKDVPAVFIDSQQIQEAIMNVIVNAEEAILNVGRGDGIIAVKTFFDKKNNLVTIKISDNGPGMTEDVALRVFEPFFSTKPPGTGIGIGLSLSRGFIIEHGGTIKISSTVGEGTVCAISFPNVNKSAG
jgi:PAS domain S-box-containing protein